MYAVTVDAKQKSIEFRSAERQSHIKKNGTPFGKKKKEGRIVQLHTILISPIRRMSCF